MATYESRVGTNHCLMKVKVSVWLYKALNFPKTMTCHFKYTDLCQAPAEKKEFNVFRPQQYVWAGQI